MAKKPPPQGVYRGTFQRFLQDSTRDIILCQVIDRRRCSGLGHLDTIDSLNLSTSVIYLMQLTSGSGRQLFKAEYHRLLARVSPEP